ncbi:MAG: Fe-S cluster assembly protein SufD [Rhodothalassiaceae bacterium]
MTDLTIFKQAFDALPDRGPSQTSAFKRFHDLGLPTRRLEEWKYTDLGGLDRAEAAPEVLAPAADPLAAHLSAERIDIINGRVAACTLARDQAVALDSEGSALVAINTAFALDPLALTLSGTTVIDLSHRTLEAEACAAHTRLTLTLEPGAQITLIERFSGDEAAYWQNAVLDISVGRGARLTHIRLSEDGRRAVHTSLTRVRLADQALYDLVTLNTGAEIARADVHVSVEAAGAEARLAAAQLARPGQSLDLRSYFDHQVAEAQSQQAVRNVLARQGRTVFQGKVRVARDAQKTDARQDAKSLLLDRTAEANTKPELEIYADDVVCAHGATVGEIDPRALFYLMSRGVAEAEAKALLIEAFVGEIAADVADEAVRDLLLARAHDWLTGASQ